MKGEELTRTLQHSPSISFEGDESCGARCPALPVSLRGPFSQGNIVKLLDSGYVLRSAPTFEEVGCPKDISDEDRDAEDGRQLALLLYMIFLGGECRGKQTEP
jgi:hypothetical protein